MKRSRLQWASGRGADFASLAPVTTTHAESYLQTAMNLILAPHPQT